MKKEILISIAFVLLLIGCKKETPAPPTVPVAEETVPEVAKKQCYAYDDKGGKIDLQIEYVGNEVSGTLNYSLAEKDSNKGTFIGKLDNKVLLLEYTFQSEGIESTRQVAFQMVGDQLVEGYGDMTLDGTHFQDVSQLKFNSPMPLSKVNCD